MVGSHQRHHPFGAQSPETPGWREGRGVQDRWRDRGEAEAWGLRRAGARGDGGSAPEGVRTGRVGGSVRTSCAAPEARVGH